MAEVSKNPSSSTELDQADSEPQDQLHAAVDKLLRDLEIKFDNVSNEMLKKMDAMTRRLEELEASLTKTYPPPPNP